MLLCGNSDSKCRGYSESFLQVTMYNRLSLALSDSCISLNIQESLKHVPFCLEGSEAENRESEVVHGIRRI